MWGSGAFHKAFLATNHLRALIGVFRHSRSAGVVGRGYGAAVLLAGRGFPAEAGGSEEAHGGVFVFVTWDSRTSMRDFWVVVHLRRDIVVVRNFGDAVWSRDSTVVVNPPIETSISNENKSRKSVLLE